MVPYITQVLESLKNIDAALAELEVLVQQERQDIVSLNLNGLTDRRSKIEERLSHIGDFNTQVIAQIRSACEDVRLAGERTLSQLITALQKPDRDNYANLQKAIRAASIKIENELAINQALLKDSLAFTNHSLQMFTGILKAKTCTTYGQQGRFVETIDQPRIICKEI